MKQKACPTCGMRGRTFGNDMCTTCAGTGFVWDYTSGGGGGGGGGGGVSATTLPLGQRLIILGGAGLVAWRVWNTRSHDLPIVWAFLAFVVTAVIISVALRILTRPFASLVILAGFLAMDHFLLGGTIRAFAMAKGPHALQSALSLLQ